MRVNRQQHGSQRCRAHYPPLIVCTTHYRRAGAGWSCEVGWDAATGLGTPRFDKLLAVAMAAV